MSDINKAVTFMKNTAIDNSHGYDQKNRNGADYDCSSLVGTALHEAGFNVSPYSWTGNLYSQLIKCGFVECKAPWLAGDVHLKVGKHVCMSISNNLIVHATCNEKGTKVGGKTGDQTGKEICVANYYNYSGGWDYHLRYIGKITNESKLLSIDTIAREVIAGRWGTGSTRKKLLTEAGYNYTEVQTKVNALITGKELKTNEEIAREVIKGKWDTDSTRKKLLTDAGYNYSEIQELVNQMLS